MTCTIRQVTTDEARRFWLQQSDARIFLHPDVLEPMCERVDWWLGEWNGNPVCLWPICQSFDGRFCPPELSAYVGPLWHDGIATFKANKWWSTTSGVQQAMLEFFAEQYVKFEFELPPGCRDVRVLQWFPGAILECRHTAILQRPERVGADDLLGLFSTNRRYDARRASRLRMQVWENPCPDELYRMYEGLLDGKMRMDTARRRKREVHALAAVTAAGHGCLLAFEDVKGRPATFSLALNSRKTTHLVLIVSTPSSRSQGLQAWSQLTAMIHCFDGGRAIFDFGGANSQLGAEEKHRYGGWPEMYFRIRVSRR